MTNKEALAEARRRWGEDAFVCMTAVGKMTEPEVFVVGCPWPYRDSNQERGDGGSWEEAFSEADRRGFK